MLPLQTSDPCTSDEFFCRTAMDLWDNEQVAEVADVVIGTPLAIGGLVILGVVVRFVLHRMIDRLVRKAEVGVLPDRVGRLSRGQGKSKAARPATAPTTATSWWPPAACSAPRRWAACSRAWSPASIVAVFTTMILAELSVDVAPIIASAGILGLALGFGAQSLVSDFLSGIFMIFEDQYGVGDVDRPRRGRRHGGGGQPAGHPAARRQRHGLVRPQRRDHPRRQHEPELGAHRARHQRRLPRGPGEGTPRAPGGRPRPVGRRGLQGPRSSRSPRSGASRRSAPTAWSIRVALKTAPLEQWSVAREMRERIKARFDFEGIEIPLPQRVVWHRGEAAHRTHDETRQDERGRAARLSCPAPPSGQARAASA